MLIAGAYGIGNLGDEALLSVIAARLRKQHMSIRVLSTTPKQTAAMHGLDAVNYFRPHRVFQALMSTDVFVIGGGGVFDTRIAGHTRRAMAWLYLTLAYLALIMNRRIWLEGISVLTPDHATYALLARVLRHAGHITVRDRQTLRNLTRLSIFGIQVVGDLSLDLRPASAEETGALFDTHRFNDASFAIGMALRATGDGETDGKITTLVKGLAGWSKECDARVFLIAFSHNPWSKGEDDASFARRLIAGIDDASRVSVFARQVHPSVLQAVVGRMDFLVGMRLQSLVMAHKMGVPMLAVAYHPKIKLFAESIGVDSIEPGAVELSVVKELIEHARIHGLQKGSGAEQAEPALNCRFPATTRERQRSLEIENPQEWPEE